jgi:hypothetical protein
MTDEELILRLRKYAVDYGQFGPALEAADRLEEYARAFANLQREYDARGERIEVLVKYRDAYAEMERIATEALRKAEARADLAQAPAPVRGTRPVYTQPVRYCPICDIADCATHRPAALEPDDGVVAELVEALRWYGEQSRLARLIHSEGDAGRHAIAADGGNRAAAVLAKRDAPMTPTEQAALWLADVTRWTKINGQEIVGSPLLDEAQVLAAIARHLAPGDDAVLIDALLNEPGHDKDWREAAAARIAALTATVGELQQSRDQWKSWSNQNATAAMSWNAKYEAAETEAATLRDRLARMEGAINRWAEHDGEHGYELVIRELIASTLPEALTDGGKDG